MEEQSARNRLRFVIDCWKTMRLTRNSYLYLIAVVMVFFVGSFYYMDVRNRAIERRRAKMFGYLKYRKNLNQPPNVRVYDLQKELDPSISNSIKCRQSGVYQQVTTTLCLHDKEKDVVSKALWKNGLWEEHIMSNH